MKTRATAACIAMLMFAPSIAAAATALDAATEQRISALEPKVVAWRPR